MKLITANKLNRLWNNGILPLFGNKIDKTKVLTTMEQVSANTNAENIAGATAVKALYNNLTAKMPSDVKFIVEGSGADVKYYAQLGADAASKKPLGDRTLKSFHTADPVDGVWVNVTIPVNDAKIVLAQSNWGQVNGMGVAFLDMVAKTSININGATPDIQVKYVNASTISIRLNHGSGATVYYM